MEHCVVSGLAFAKVLFFLDIFASSAFIHKSMTKRLVLEPCLCFEATLQGPHVSGTWFSELAQMQNFGHYFALS